MGEFGSPSTNTHHHNHRRHHQLPFTVGSEIEVSIDEEGFKGALFKATILKLPTTFSPSKKKKALVEYKTLVTEDGSTPLKEHVDVLSLRPLPPDTADKDFEECDIVDAADKDGWWTGVVCKALEGGGYSVLFKNPMHVMDFQRNHLRLHQDWVDDKWLVPQKMDVSILRDQLSIISEDANVPESVQHESLKNIEANNEKENSCTVNSRNGLMEKPSIYDESSASFALTSSKRRRSLSSKSRVSNPSKKLGEENVPGTPAADRSRMIESKTSRGKAFSKSATPNRDRRRRNYLNFHCDNDSASPNKFESPKGSKKLRTKEDVDGSDELKEQGLSLINGNRGNTFKRRQQNLVSDKEGKEDYDVLEIIPKEVTTTNESERNKHLASDEKQTPVKNSLCLPDEVGDGEENSNNQTKEKGMEPEQQEATENSDKRKRGRPRKTMQEPGQQQASKNSYKRKRGRPRKLMIVPTTAEDMEQDGSGWKPEKATAKSCVTDLNRRNGKEVPAYKTNGTGTNSVDDDDRPLLMWLGGIQGSASNNSLKLGQTSGSTAKRRTKGSEQIGAVNEERTVDETPENEVVKNQGWPFVKNSPVWSAIDSLEVFKQIPQKPHFHPLSTYKEECREGLAIGCMVTFASLVEKITKLQFNYPRYIFESTLASLYDLEQHGFNISMLCNRVNELLFIKDTEMRYIEETKVAENKILEHTENKTMLAEESKAIEQKIIGLQRRQSSIKLEIETKDQEIEALQSHVEAIRECTINTKLHFENQIALPLWPV